MSVVVVGGRDEEVVSKVKNSLKTVASTFIPTNIKEAFEIAEQIYKSNIMIFRTMYKLAEYPITPLKYIATKNEDDNRVSDADLKLSGPMLEERYREIFEDHIDINRALIELNLNYYLYSNDFPMLHLPFDRKAVCKKCLKKAESKIGKDDENRSSLLKGVRDSLAKSLDELTELKWEKEGFTAKCGECKNREEYSSWDVVNRMSLDDVFIGRLNIHQMTIQQLEFSGKRRYLYEPSKNTVSKVKKNDLFTLMNEPMIVLKSCLKNDKIEYNPKDIFHFRMPSPIFKDNSPWSWPLLISAFQTIFFISTLRRGAEAIAIEHINPKHYIAPAKEIDSLLTQYSMAEIRNNILEAYNEAQKDDGQVTALPFPITTGIMNQQGRAFLPQNEISQATTELLSGLGLAEGLISGEGPFNGNSIAIRILENGFLSQRDMTQRYIDYLQKKIQFHFNLGQCDITMTDFRKLDDSLHKQMVANAVDRKRISNRTFVTTLGFNNEEEQTQIEKETEYETKQQAKMEALLEGERSELRSKSEDVYAAKMTERQLQELQKQTDTITFMIDNLIKKNWSRAAAMNYVSQYMAQQTASMEAQAAQARASEAQAAYMRDRLANATTSLNKANNQMQVSNTMNQVNADPAMQMLNRAGDAIGGIVQRCKLMNDNDRKNYLDSVEQTDQEVYAQVMVRLQQEGVII